MRQRTRPPLLIYLLTYFTQDNYPEGANDLQNSRICTFEPTMFDFIDVVLRVIWH